MSLSTLEFSFVTVACVFATWFILRAAAKSNRKYPFSERFCLLILRFASWLECCGIAYDACILRYRMERRVVSIEMASTAARMMAEEDAYNVSEEAATDRALDVVERDFPA